VTFTKTPDTFRFVFELLGV